MSEQFPLLTDEALMGLSDIASEQWGSADGGPPVEILFGRAVEREARAPLLARIGALEGAVDRLAPYEVAFKEWHDKTEWVQKELSAGRLPVKYLGWHRADVIRAEVEQMRERIAELEQQLSTAREDGEQALRERVLSALGRKA